MSRVIDYVSGTDRNNPDEVRSHYYVLTAADHYWPMCDYGWNRSNGERFSIFRGWRSARGHCKICMRRREQGLRPIIKARPHKTRWL